MQSVDEYFILKNNVSLQLVTSKVKLIYFQREKEINLNFDF